MTGAISQTDPVLAEIALLIPEGNVLKLPDTQLAHYPKIKTLLKKAGGTYKRCCFHFNRDAKLIQAELVGGATLDDVKKYQYFPTPSNLVDKAIRAADLQPHHTWLEPSAGQGAIASKSKAISPYGMLIELMPENANLLRKQGYLTLEMDFLDLDGGKFDRIIANPPFSRNADIKHIQKMYEHLTDNGILVSFASKSWTFGSQKIQQKFRDWLVQVGAVVEEIESGAFKASGTNISTVMITIKR